MTTEEKFKIGSNDYVDLFVIYNRNKALLDQFPNSTTHIINTRYAIAYVPADILKSNFIGTYSYAPLPHCYGLTSSLSLEASRVTRLRGLSGFNLRGNGVLTAIIDTGIDYRNPIFRKEDGTTRIAALWDQTIDSDRQYPENTFYGTEYSKEQINLALASKDPLSIVPSTDEIGHGTMLSGVMAGSEVPGQDFAGAAPQSDLIVVKLKQAKQNIRDFFIIPPDVPCYQENDILWALHYVINTAKKLNQPCAICIGLGTSQGSHDNFGILGDALDLYTTFPGFCICISAGNEGNKRKHFSGSILSTQKENTIELNVANNEPGFSLEIWGSGPNTYYIDLISPTGEYISPISESLQASQDISFIFETVTISVNYQIVETTTGEQLILLRFRNPTPGNWKITVYSRGDLPGSINAWLPLSNFISNDTYFNASDRFTTITTPGNAASPITLTSYNPINDILFRQAGIGYSRDNMIKPELAAPGVNIIVPSKSNSFVTASGTGIAAAHAAGITALMLEWGIIKGFYPLINTIVIKKYLIRGARRDQNRQYPNQEWGYGIVDLYNVFNTLRIDVPH